MVIYFLDVHIVRCVQSVRQVTFLSVRSRWEGLKGTEMELNPNHPVTSKMHDHWHKIAALLLNRTREKKTIITIDEVNRIADMAITMKETAAGIELKIVTMAEGERLAKKEGGLPV